MLFNSWEYALFLPAVLLLYWFVANKNLKGQNLLLLLAGIFFYGSWDIRFIPLLSFSIVLDYFTGLRIGQAETRTSKKLWLALSLTTNLGLLAFFKYYNFFTSNVSSLFGYHGNIWSLNIILPLGISFYTFHGISYVLDIYMGRFKPTTNFIDYAVFVSFFPLLIAGPIERAPHLLPQIQTPRTFDSDAFLNGMKQILWGLFKKMVIADNCAPFVNSVYNNYHTASAGTLLLGAILFPMQVYCDFSGYSDIAIGSARMMGFDLFRNFAYPYFSRDMSEFWRRWHISLSSWLRDYVYIPLGGNRGGKWLTTRNIFITFFLSGLWHGANWTFIAFGILNAFYVIPIVLFRKGKPDPDIVATGKLLPGVRDMSKMAFTFCLASVMLIFFRASNIQQAIGYICDIFSRPMFAFSEAPSVKIIVLLVIFMTTEWLGREQQFAIANIPPTVPKYIRWSVYYLLVLSLFLLAAQKEQKFVYFQF